MGIKPVKYKLEPGMNIHICQHPEMHVVGGGSPYLWIGNDTGGCYGTRDLKDLKGLYNALKQVMHDEQMRKHGTM